jgi:hypothetical protein
MTLWNKTVKLVTGTEPKTKRRKKLTRRDLIRLESQIGAQLFGPVPAGHRREFFCLDDNTWIWYECWIEKGKQLEVTTRYEVHPNGVLKVQDGQPYVVVEGEELQNLALAARLYHDRVAQEVYNRDPISGQRITA